MSRHVVIGPPGTGKTHYLSRQAALVAERYGGDGIYVCSLTKTAAKEIASRCPGATQRNIGTLHSLAFRALGLTKAKTAQSPEGIAAWNQSAPAFWKLTGAMRRDVHTLPSQMVFAAGTGDELLGEIEILRSRRVAVSSWPGTLTRFWARWSAWKSKGGLVDFADMIELALDAPAPRGLHTLFVDEAQDMSLLEIALVNHWAAQAERLVLAGDPDQAIYGFRGADANVMHEVEADSTHVLAQSYRVPRAVHSRAGRWIAGSPEHVPADYLPRDADGLIARHAFNMRTGEPVARLLKKLLTDGSTVMLLASCGYMLNQTIRSCREHRIPYGNPYRLGQGFWNPINTVGRSRALAFLRMHESAWGDDARIWNWSEVVRWTEPMLDDVFEPGRREWIQSKATTKTRIDWEEFNSVETLTQVLDCFRPECREPVRKGDLWWWWKHLRLQDFRAQQYQVALALRHGPAILRESPKLIVGSIHSAKGGEADKVVLAPDLSQNGYREFVRRSGPTIRMMYVGMTRARSELHILAPSNRYHVHI